MRSKASTVDFGLPPLIATKDVKYLSICIWRNYGWIYTISPKSLSYHMKCENQQFEREKSFNRTYELGKSLVELSVHPLKNSPACYSRQNHVKGCYAAAEARAPRVAHRFAKTRVFGALLTCPHN